MSRIHATYKSRDSRGEDIYNHIEANLHWELFLDLGKVQPTVYVPEHR